MDPFIKTEILKEYKKHYHDDYYIETPDKKYALYFYNIDEPSMNFCVANLSIFAENKFDSPLLSSGKVSIIYKNSKTFTYAQKSGCLIFRMGANSVTPVKPILPYLLIKPKTSQFSLIDWDVTSYYYFLEEVNENILMVKEESPKELDRLNYLRRTGEIINLTELTWYDFAQFDNMREIYINR